MYHREIVELSFHDYDFDDVGLRVAEVSGVTSPDYVERTEHLLRTESPNPVCT